MKRDDWARRIATLDAERDHHEIYRILVAHEFPWDMNQALSFALFRTYAVPSIGRLLAQTGEFTQRTHTSSRSRRPGRSSPPCWRRTNTTTSATTTVPAPSRRRRWT